MLLKRSAIFLAILLQACAPSAAQLGPANPSTLSGETGEKTAVNPALWPAAKSPAAITDPTVEAAINAILQKMTLEQKIGQMIQADISAVTPGDLASYPLG